MSTARIKLSLGVGITLLFCLWGNAQVSVSYYSSSLSKAGIAYDFNERVWGELPEKVQLYTLTGQLVDEQVRSKAIPVRDLRSGLYLVKIHIASQVVSRKLVVY